jgi:hypothetical protein
MIPVIPWYLELIVLATNLAVGITVWRILSSAALRSGVPPAGQRRVRIGSAIFLIAWLGGILLLAPPAESLATRDPFYITPLIPLFVLGPITIVLLLIWGSQTFRHVLAATSLPALIGVQVYRTIGAVFLILLSQGQLPAHFALPAGWGDIAVGLSAPFVAFAVARGAPAGRSLAALWSVLGLLDLMVAVGMGTGFLAPLLSLGPRLPSAGAMGVFPMIVVPAFAVPVSVLLHLIVLARLRRRVGSVTELVGQAR